MTGVKFSVVIPTYNRARFIRTAIESVLEQTYDNFEIFVVDDGSTDGTADSVKSIEDSRVTYHYKKNEERAIARNTGIGMANGEYIAFLDSDDVLYPNHFDVAAKMIEKHSSPEWFHVGYEFLGSNGRESVRVDKLPNIANDVLIEGNHLSCNGVFIRRDIAGQFPFCPIRALSGTEDYELWLRLASRFPLYCDNTVTSAIVPHDERSVLNADKKELVTRIELLERQVLSDSEFPKKFSRHVGRFKANNRLYIALHLALSKNNRLGAVEYLARALALSPYALANRSFYGTIKRIFI